jgi:glycosyltransferase involved in cell wall biosynthesis
MSNIKIGFLLCAYNQEEFIGDCLKDLVKFSTKNGHLISAVSVPFAEYKDLEVQVDSTTDILRKRLLSGDIDFLTDSPDHMAEADARTAALKPLLDCDLIWLVDSDEIYSYEQLNDIANFVENSEFINWFSLSFKNYVGEGYLKEAFTPPRIFNTKIKNGKLSHFYYDNDVMYDTKYGQVNYKVMSSKLVPASVAWIDHLSWTNTDKNKLKCDYQNKHFGHCSYKWEDGQGIIFDDNYYKKTGELKPEIIYE